MIAWLTIQKATLHFGYVVEAMFFRARYVFHQEWLPHQPLFYHRTVGWLVLSFATIGLLMLLKHRKRFESCVMFAWLIAALTPGILSSVPYPKRLSSLFPAIDILAALGLATLLCAVTLGGRRWRRGVAIIATSVGLVIFTCFDSYAWFSGRLFSYGEPPENAVAAELTKAITPHTVVFAELTAGYESGKYLYLLMDHLTDPANRPNMWIQSNLREIDSFLDKPSRIERFIGGKLPYLWTRLRDQLTETTEYQNWTDVLFILQRGEGEIAAHQAVLARCKAACANPVVVEVPAQSQAWNSLTLVRCPYAEIMHQSDMPPTE
jgi:hypothetical protein